MANIQADRHRFALSRFLSGLRGLGYRTPTLVVTAAAAGAAHRRRRWWCYATHLDGSPKGPLGTPNGRVAPSEMAVLPADCYLPTPIAGDSSGPSNENTLSGRVLGAPPCHAEYGHPPLAGPDGRLGPDGWGKHQPAVDRWTEIIGDPPPEMLRYPGRKQLSAGFVEWMMGFPSGFVSDITGNRQALIVLGNAAVPRQTALAVRKLVDTPTLF